MNSTGYLTYVADMLSSHDAVVIPGFGGFITKYKPARIAEEEGRIHPPTKYIAFNEHLDIHDNTFARFLDEQTSAHYSPRLFDHFTSQLKSNLANNKVIVVPKVGRLYQDYEGATHFMPDLLNLNNDTFGLPQINCTKGEWAKSAISKAASEIKAGSLKTALSSAATVALLFLVVLGGIGPFVDKNNNTAELSIIDTTTETPSTSELEESSILAEDKIQKDDLASIPVNPTEETSALTQKAVIIVGAFGSETNAAKMIREIESQGYTSYQDRPSKLNRVGVEVSYSSEEELNLILSNVQERITSRAWILK